MGSHHFLFRPNCHRPYRDPTYHRHKSQFATGNPDIGEAVADFDRVLVAGGNPLTRLLSYSP
jgi:hypothetical protein